jgi:mycofactocin glycosyltransferase
VARRPAVAGAIAAVSTGLFARRLRRVVEHPWSVAAQVVGEGTLRSSLASASGLARAAGPLALVALLPRRSRPAAAAVLVLPALADWWATRPDLDPVRYTAAHIADDAAYGAGVWLGCLRARALRPLLPEIVWRTSTGGSRPG